jgi:hypothetical protein
MATKISQDIGYKSFGNVFKCKKCGRPLLMDGCDNPECENFYQKNIRKEFLKNIRKESNN